MKKLVSALVGLFLFVLLIGGINKTSEKSKKLAVESSDPIVLPCIYEEFENEKIYLKKVNLVDYEGSFIKNILSYDYLKDSIGVNDIFLEYTFRNESIYKSDTIITERSYISCYVPTDNKDYYVSTMLIPYNMIEPKGCRKIKPMWSDKGLLSSKDNNIEQDILKVYKKIKTKTSHF